jgi:hypothetical protein
VLHCGAWLRPQRRSAFASASYAGDFEVPTSCSITEAEVVVQQRFPSKWFLRRHRLCLLDLRNLGEARRAALQAWTRVHSRQDRSR